MEQQQEKTRREAEPRREPAEKSPRFRERSAETVSAARMLLEGGSVWELPPRTLRELAAGVGNSGMLALLGHGAAEPVQVDFLPPDGSPETEPFLVPCLACTQAPPRELTGQGAPPGPAFDAGLRG